MTLAGRSVSWKIGVGDGIFAVISYVSPALWLKLGGAVTTDPSAKFISNATLDQHSIPMIHPTTN